MYISHITFCFHFCIKYMNHLCSICLSWMQSWLYIFVDKLYITVLHACVPHTTMCENARTLIKKHPIFRLLCFHIQYYPIVSSLSMHLKKLNRDDHQSVQPNTMDTYTLTFPGCLPWTSHAVFCIGDDNDPTFLNDNQEIVTPWHIESVSNQNKKLK